MSGAREYAGAIAGIVFLILTIPGTAAILAAIWAYQGTAVTVGFGGVAWIVYAFLIGFGIETTMEKYNLAQKDIKVAIALQEAEKRRAERGAV